jgi:nucleotide-binding universal stress UspA family protein
MKTVLAPLDFSAASNLVLVESVALARRLEARLVLLHVVQPVPIIPPAFGVADTGAEVPAAASESARRRLHALQRELLASSVTAHTIHVLGDPGRAIVEQAQRLDADFIVMGSRGHTALYDLVIGSTASHVLKTSPCPVLLLPPHMRAPTETAHAPVEAQSV